MKTVCIIGNEDGSVREVILKVLATNAPTTFAQTAFKDSETGEITSIMPENKMFEMTNILRDKEIKSGREKRRIKRQAQRRKQQRKK